jgi:hypothetical protein
MAVLYRPGKYRLRARVRDPRDLTAGVVTMALVAGASSPAPSTGYLAAGWEAGVVNIARLSAALDSAALPVGAHAASSSTATT